MSIYCNTLMNVGYLFRVLYYCTSSGQEQKLNFEFNCLKLNLDKVVFFQSKF
jgi:hypothetical protein